MAGLLDHVAALPDPARRQQALAALAAAGPARLDALREGTTHVWWRVRRWSCRLLEDEALDGPTATHLIAAARGDPHKKVRRQALHALVCESYVARSASPGGLPAGYDLVGLLLERLRNDRSVSVRRSAATGLMYQVVLNGNREGRVRRGLRRAMLTEQDEALRRRARQALAVPSGAGQEGPYGPLEWAITERRVELALRLGRGHMRRWEDTGEFGEARKWLERVLAASKGAPPSLLAPALHDAGFAAMMTGDLDAATRHLRASVAQWGLAGERAAAVRTKSLLAFLASSGDDPGPVEELEADVAEVRATGDNAALFDVLAACGQARMFRGAPHLARRHFEEAVALAGEAGIPEAATAFVGLGSAELGQGDYPAAEAHLAEGILRSEAAGDDHTEVIGCCWLAEVERLRGNDRRARSLLEECVRRSRLMDAPYPLALALLGLVRAALEGGDVEVARSLSEQAAAAAAATRLNHLATVAGIGRAEVALAGGDAATAAKALEVARRGARRRGDALATARCCYHFGELARAGCHLLRAAALHDQALALRESAGDRAGVADSLEALAGLAMTTGTDERAARMFGAAEALREATGAVRSRWHAATYQTDVARLRERMNGDDLQSSWAEGAAMPLGEAVWHARRGRGRRNRPRRGWEALTPAQRRVAELVAQGLSNAEVAERLFVGPETVKTHVAGVLAKLEMSSRAELRVASRSTPVVER